MKKWFVIPAVALLLVTAGCSSNEIEIVNEASQSAETTAETSLTVQQMAPQSISVKIPYKFNKTGNDYDMTGAVEILEEDAQIKGLGADTILRCGDNDFYYFTSGETEVAIVALPKKDDIYVAFYYDGKLKRVYNSEYTWYFEDGKQTYTVYSYSSDNAIIYSFYDESGTRLFTRVGDEYYDSEYNLLDGEELEKFRQIYGESAEFAEN